VTEGATVPIVITLDAIGARPWSAECRPWSCSSGIVSSWPRCSRRR